MKVSELETPHAKILGYGVSGAGKTRFGGTMPGPRYWFNFEENNIVTLKQNGFEADYDNYDNYTAILSKIISLKKSCPYNTVVVDNGYGFYKVMMDHILKLGSREVPQIQDYGLAQDRTRSLFKELLHLPAHVLIIFHEQIEKDETQGKVMGRILIQGKNFPDELPGMFNMFLRFVVVPVKDSEPARKIQTTPSLLFPAGDKYGALAPLEEPDFSKIWAKVEAKMGKIKEKILAEAETKVVS